MEKCDQCYSPSICKDFGCPKEIVKSFDNYYRPKTVNINFKK